MCEALHQPDVLLEAMMHKALAHSHWEPRPQHAQYTTAQTQPTQSGLFQYFRQITHHAAGGRDGISLTIGKPGEGNSDATRTSSFASRPTHPCFGLMSRRR